MKKFKFSILFILLMMNKLILFAQNNIPDDRVVQVKDRIKSTFEKWLIKSDFETNKEYSDRITNLSQLKLSEISDTCINELKRKFISNYKYLKFFQYNSESLILTLIEKEYEKDTFNIIINKEFAKSMFSDEKNQLDILFIPNDFNIDFENNFIETISGSIFFCEELHWRIKLNPQYIVKLISASRDNEYKGLQFITLNNNSDLKNYEKFTMYSYKFNKNEHENNNELIKYQPKKLIISDLNIQLPEIILTNENDKKQLKENSEANLDYSQLKIKQANENSIAVIVGNTNYINTKKVNFGINDANTIYQYLVKVLGYKVGNILYQEDLGKSGFELLFGTSENPQAKLANIIKPGVSDVFVYYSGHGAPGLKDNKGYFVPIDCDPNYIEQTGYSLDLFYRNLAKLNAKSVTVVTDACFSGAELFNNISPITINISNPFSVQENCVIFSSSTGSQVSSWFNEKKHGLFTYYFLRAFQDVEKSDTNKDNKLTYKEIADYVSDKTNGVPYMARKLHNVDQNPTIQGSGVDNVFIEFK